MTSTNNIDIGLVKELPQSNLKLAIEIDHYSLLNSETPEDLSKSYKSHTIYISPSEIKFLAPPKYSKGSILKILVKIPDYWPRKKNLVKYTRIDKPENFKILAKVIETEDTGKRKRKKAILAKVVNIDEIDEKILNSYINEVM